MYFASTFSHISNSNSNASKNPRGNGTEPGTWKATVLAAKPSGTPTTGRNTGQAVTRSDGERQDHAMKSEEPGSQKQ
jgi:hypothetical protein